MAKAAFPSRRLSAPRRRSVKSPSKGQSAYVANSFHEMRCPLRTPAGNSREHNYRLFWVLVAPRADVRTLVLMLDRWIWVSRTLRTHGTPGNDFGDLSQRFVSNTVGPVYNTMGIKAFSSFQWEVIGWVFFVITNHYIAFQFASAYTLRHKIEKYWLSCTGTIFYKAVLIRPL